MSSLRAIILWVIHQPHRIFFSFFEGNPALPATGQHSFCLVRWPCSACNRQIILGVQTISFDNQTNYICGLANEAIIPPIQSPIRRKEDARIFHTDEAAYSDRKTYTGNDARFRTVFRCKR